ncbi:hypothetical protein PMAYCL1PPCAC_04656, partial [Pristionchus mayeri]
MMLALLVVSALLSASNALSCYHNANATYEYYNNGVIVYSYSSTLDFGVNQCSAKLNNCVRFNSMPMSFFKTLDVGKENTPFSNMLGSTVDGKANGR